MSARSFISIDSIVCGWTRDVSSIRPICASPATSGCEGLSDGLLLQQSHQTEASVGEERLVHCDPIDEATTRRLLQQAAVARSTPAYRRVACPREGAIVAHRHRNTCNITIRKLRRRRWRR